MKTVLSLLICVSLFGATYATSQLPPGDIITVRVVELATKGGKIVVTYKGGEQNIIELDGGGKSFEVNTAITNKTLNDIADQGYKLVGVAAGNYAGTITTYVFVKE